MESRKLKMFMLVCVAVVTSLGYGVYQLFYSTLPTSVVTTAMVFGPPEGYLAKSFSPRIGAQIGADTWFIHTGSIILGSGRDRREWSQPMSETGLPKFPDRYASGYKIPLCVGNRAILVDGSGRPILYCVGGAWLGMGRIVNGSCLLRFEGNHWVPIAPPQETDWAGVKDIWWGDFYSDWILDDSDNLVIAGMLGVYTYRPGAARLELKPYSMEFSQEGLGEYVCDARIIAVHPIGLEVELLIGDINDREHVSRTFFLGPALLQEWDNRLRPPPTKKIVNRLYKRGKK